MKRDTFYFPHDYNARNDVKNLFLRQQLGMEGYGIFWFLIESLADAGGVLPLKIVPVLAMQMQVPDVKVLAVIQNFELFQLVENSFFSIRLNIHLDLRKTLAEKGREGAAISWQNRRKNGEANGGAIGEGNAKESKGKEIKESNTPADLSKSNLFRKPTVPTKKEVWEVFSRNGGTKEMAKSFYEKYEALGWFKNGSAISSFTSLVPSFVTNWKRNESKGKTFDMPTAPPLKPAS